MGQDIAAHIRNVMISATLVVLMVIVGVFLYFASNMVLTRTQQQIQTVPKILMNSQLEAFYQQNYGAMQTTVNSIVKNGREHGIAYIGMTDNNGRMHTSGVSASLSTEQKSEIENDQLTSIEENLIISSTESITLNDGTKIIDVIIPVRQNDQTYGAIKIGFLENSFYGPWNSFRNRIIFTSVLLILFFVIVVLVYAQRWRQWIDNSLTKKENRVRREYEERIDEIEQKSSSGPLSSDEFFEIIDFCKKLPKNLEPAQMLRYLVNATVRILNVKQVVIFLLSPDDSSVLQGQMGMKNGEWMDRDRLQGIEIEVGSGEIGTIAELGQTNILDKPEPGAGVAGALRSEGETIGVLRATEKETGTKMENKDKLRVRLICQLSGELVAHAFDVQKLREAQSE